MNTKSKVDKIAEVLFFSAIIIEVLIVIIDKSALINPFEGRLFQVTFALCILKIALTKHNLKEWILIVLFLTFGFMAYKITARNDIIRFIAFIAASKGMDARRVLKVVFFMTLTGMAILILLSLFGVLGTVYLETDYYRGTGVEKRYCLGLGHPDALHCMFLMLLSLGVYLYYGRLRVWHYLLLMVFNIGLFFLTDSRAGMIVSGIVIGSGLFSTLVPKIKDSKVLYVISGLCLCICVGFSIWVADYNGFERWEKYPFLGWLNSKLTGRILDAGVTGNIHKWSLFSDKANKGYLDMGYIKLFHWYGMIPAIIYIIIILMMIIKCYQKSDAAALILIMSFTIYTVVEAHAVSPYFGRNYMIMLLFGTWSELFHVSKGEQGYFWQIHKYLDVKQLQEK